MHKHFAEIQLITLLKMLHKGCVELLKPMDLFSCLNVYYLLVSMVTKFVGKNTIKFKIVLKTYHKTLI